MEKDLKPKREPLKVGDRVRVYRGGRKPITGQVSNTTISNSQNAIFVIEDGFYSCTNDSPYHPTQVRRLKPSVQKIKLTRKQVEEAMTEKLCASYGFSIVEIRGKKEFLKALGFDEVGG